MREVEIRGFAGSEADKSRAHHGNAQSGAESYQDSADREEPRAKE